MILPLAPLAFALATAFVSAPPAPVAQTGGDGVEAVYVHTALRHVGGPVLHFARANRPAPIARKSPLLPQPWLRR